MEAMLVTPFLQIKKGAEMCLKFYYSMVGEQRHLGRVVIKKRGTNGQKTSLAQFDTRTKEEWKIGFVLLGSGLFQVEFFAKVGKGPNGDMAIDDIMINECHAFSKSIFNSSPLYQ